MVQPFRGTLREKLAEYSDSPTLSGCIEWNGCTDRHGYGTMIWKRQPARTHRKAWEAHKGAIPKGSYVCHHCDNRLCLNPDHLFLGTARENSADMVTKGRSSRGERSGHAKLTTENVLSIRASGEGNQVLADRYGVSNAAIWQARNRYTWRHV